MPSIPDNLPVEIRNRYDIVNNTFIRKDKGEKHAELEVEIGDTHSDAFEPQFKIKRWDNECNFSVRLIDDAVDVPKMQTDKNKIKFVKNKLEAHFYNISKTEEMPECYEFEVVLKKKPETNKVQMSIEMKGLVFYYQPELTQEEIDEGCYRPENVVGSYAVYHESKAGDYSKIGKKNYRAGKAFHIYRPKIIDNAGEEVWGKLNITNNLLTIEIPQEFLDNAVYPVRVDPTFGETGIGTTDEYDNDLIVGSWFNAPESGTVDSIHVYDDYGSTGPTYLAKCAIYKKQDLSKVCESEQKSDYAPGWVTFNVAGSPSITNQDYWLLHWQSRIDQEIRYDTGAAANKGHTTTNYSYNGWPDPITISGQTKLYSIYCTYTETAAGAAIPVIIHHLQEQGIS